MKAFEKQWLKKSCEINVDCKDLDCRDCKVIAKKWWEEALKWVLTNKEKITDAQFQCEAPVEMICADVIEEELENFD